MGSIPLQGATGENIFNLTDEEMKDVARILPISLVSQRTVHQTLLGATTLCGLD
jgi:hypothetical protein